MKFLPDEPPASVPGRVAQRGPLGPFIRGGRLPVDVRRSTQVSRRAAFGYAAKQWPGLTVGEQDDWRALSSSGTRGQAKCCGRSVVFGVDAPIPDATPPAAPSATTLAIAGYGLGEDFFFVSFSITGATPARVDLFSTGQRPLAGVWNAPGVLVGSYDGPFPGGRQFFADYAARFGPLVLGQTVTFWASASVDGLLVSTYGRVADVVVP